MVASLPTTLKLTKSPLAMFTKKTVCTNSRQPVVLGLEFLGATGSWNCPIFDQLRIII